MMLITSSIKELEIEPNVDKICKITSFIESQHFIMLLTFSF